MRREGKCFPFIMEIEREPEWTSKNLVELFTQMFHQESFVFAIEAEGPGGLYGIGDRFRNGRFRDGLFLPDHRTHLLRVDLLVLTGLGVPEYSASKGQIFLLN